MRLDIYVCACARVCVKRDEIRAPSMVCVCMCVKRNEIRAFSLVCVGLRLH